MVALLCHFHSDFGQHVRDSPSWLQKRFLQTWFDVSWRKDSWNILPDCMKLWPKCRIILKWVMKTVKPKEQWTIASEAAMEDRTVAPVSWNYSETDKEPPRPNYWISDIEFRRTKNSLHQSKAGDVSKLQCDQSVLNLNMDDEKMQLMEKWLQRRHYRYATLSVVI